MDNHNIDEKIRLALSKDDADLFDELAGEQSLFDQALQLLKGRNRWFNIMVMFITLVFLAIGAICIWQFSQAEETKTLLAWALGLIFSLTAVSMLKLWAWMEMEKNSTIREIKRLELQVAHLSRKLDLK